jgi:hypothetical protein
LTTTSSGPALHQTRSEDPARLRAVSITGFVMVAPEPVREYQPALFPALTFGANLAASFPTLFSTASGIFSAS